MGSVVLIAVLLTFCIVVTSACNNSKDDGSSSAPPPTSGSSSVQTEDDPGEPVQLTLTHGVALDSGKGLVWEWLLNELEEVSDGNITGVQEGNGTICDDATTLDAMLDGVVQFGHGVVSYHTGTIPELGPLCVPGYFAGDKEKWLEFTEALQEPLEAVYAKYGLKYLAADFSSTGALFGNGKQIVTPDDCKGMLIRSNGPYLTAALESWGASATVLGIADLATALERGTIDYAYSGYPIVKELSMYELVDYVTFTPISETFSCMLMTMDLWESLSPQQQKYCEEVFAEYPSHVWDELYSNYEPYVQFSKDNGNSVVELSEEQALVFTEKCKPIIEESKASSGPEGLAVLKVIYEFNNWEWED
jgi:TRAP-type C4-dicarboxylate transport system substrate-binding protein